MTLRDSRETLELRRKGITLEPRGIRIVWKIGEEIVLAKRKSVFQISKQRNAYEDLSCKRGYVEYPGKVRYPIGKNVFALPVTDLRRSIAG